MSELNAVICDVCGKQIPCFEPRIPFEEETPPPFSTKKNLDMCEDCFKKFKTWIAKNKKKKK